MNSTINRGNAARALLEHGGHAPWWFDLWGESGEYSAGGAVQRAVEVTGDTVQLRPGAAIYRRDLRDADGPVAVNIRAGGLASGRVLTFEFHIETGAAVPEIAWDESIAWEDFGGPWHIEPFRTTVFFFRSTDGGKTWTGGKAYTFGPKTLHRGGLIQRAADVAGTNVVLDAETAIYRIDLSGRSGDQTVSIDAARLDDVTRCNTLTAELHFRAGANGLSIARGANVTWEDFGGLWRLEAGRVTVAAARSTDGGLTWTIGKLYTYKE